ncbi:MAG: M48 family metalloprotease [Legionella sp.]|nr:M48 family metalloprotease [Legionella sp.]
MGTRLFYRMLTWSLYGGIIHEMLQSLSIQLDLLQDAEQKKAEEDRLPLEEKQAREDATFQVKQAFKDIGLSREVHVRFNPSEKEVFGNNMSTYNGLENWRRAAVVTIFYKKLNFIQDQKQIYAIAGHEAIHSKHEHTLISSIILGGLIPAFYQIPRLIHTPWILNACFFVPMSLYLTGNILSYFQEMDADLSAAKKLGSGSEKIKLFKSLIKENEEISMPIVPDHPSHQTRINYLKPYQNQSLLFFKLASEIRKEKPFANQSNLSFS